MPEQLKLEQPVVQPFGDGLVLSESAAVLADTLPEPPPPKQARTE